MTRPRTVFFAQSVHDGMFWRITVSGLFHEQPPVIAYAITKSEARAKAVLELSRRFTIPASSIDLTFTQDRKP